MPDAKPPIVHSHSGISTFEKCPLQFRFRYIDREAPRFATMEAFLGTVVHEAIEGLYREVMERGRAPTMQEVIAFYNSAWERGWARSQEKGPPVLIVRGNPDPAHHRAVGEKWVTAYYDAFHPFDQEEVMGVEMKLRFKVLERWEFVAVLDRLTRAGPGLYRIHDLKTGRRALTSEEASKDPQLGLYHLALLKDPRFADATEVLLLWYYAALGEGRVTHRTPEDLARLEEDIGTKVKIIEATTDYPAVKGPLCLWCGFKPVCPAWK